MDCLWTEGPILSKNLSLDGEQRWRVVVKLQCGDISVFQNPPIKRHGLLKQKLKVLRNKYIITYNSSSKARLFRASCKFLFLRKRFSMNCFLNNLLSGEGGGAGRDMLAIVSGPLVTWRQAHVHGLHAVVPMRKSLQVGSESPQQEHNHKMNAHQIAGLTLF